MAFSKVIFNGDTLMDVTGDTVAANNLLSGYQATGANGQKVSGGTTVPTKTSDLTNDGEDGTSDYATEAYVNSAVPSTYVSTFNGSSGAITYTAPVTSVNAKTGAVSLSASDVGALPSSTSIPTKTSDLTNDSNFVSDASYVHTDNNFTSTLKTKLDGIATGAEVNVQSDWNVTSSSSDAYIKNKPTIPTQTSQLTNNSNFVEDASYVHTDNNFTTTLKDKLDGIASGAEVNVQADWSEASSSSDAYIQNKPTIPSKVSDLTNDSGFQTASDVSTALGSYVARAGDSMTGGLTFADANFPTSAPSSNYFGAPYVSWNDSGGNQVGFFTSFFRANGERGFQFGTGRTVNGTTRYNTIELIIDDTNTRKVGGLNAVAWRDALGVLPYNNSVDISSIVVNGYVTSSQKQLAFFVPYPLFSGTSISITSLSIAIRATFADTTGGYPYARSGSNGGTYTQLGASLTSIWANGATVRTGEVSSLSGTLIDGCGFNISLNFGYALTSDTSTTVIRNNVPFSARISITATVS